jgi:hypothetical protein
MTKAEMLEHIRCTARPRADCRGQRLMGFVGIDFDG